MSRACTEVQLLPPGQNYKCAPLPPPLIPRAPNNKWQDLSVFFRPPPWLQKVKVTANPLSPSALPTQQDDKWCCHCPPPSTHLSLPMASSWPLAELGGERKAEKSSSTATFAFCSQRKGKGGGGERSIWSPRDGGEQKQHFCSWGGGWQSLPVIILEPGGWRGEEQLHTCVLQPGGAGAGVKTVPATSHP